MSQSLTDFQKQRVVEKLRRILSHNSHRYECYTVGRINDDDDNAEVYRWAMFADDSYKCVFATTREFTFLEDESEITMEDMYLYLGLDVHDDQVKHEFGVDAIRPRILDSDDDDNIKEKEEEIGDFMNEIQNYEFQYGSEFLWNRYHSTTRLQNDRGERVFRVSNPASGPVLLYGRPRGDYPSEDWRWIIKTEADRQVIAYFFTGPGGKYERVAPCEPHSSAADVYKALFA